MGYRLYLDNYEDVSTYENCVIKKYDISDVKKCVPVKFTKNNKVKDVFKIEELDAVLSKYTSKEEFLRDLKKCNMSYLTEDERNSNTLSIISKNNRKFINIKPIFYDKLIYTSAINLIDKKNKSKSLAGIKLDITEEIENLIRVLKVIAMDEKMNGLLLSPFDVEYLSESDKRKINKKRFDDLLVENKKYDERVSKPGLRTLLKNYTLYYKQKQKNDLIYVSSIEVNKELAALSEDIKNFFKEYLNVRTVVEWENDCITALKNAKPKTALEKELIKYQLDVFDRIKVLRNGYSIIPTPIDKGFDNKNIEYNCEHGGMDEVYRDYDLDDLLSQTENDQEKLGYKIKCIKDLK